MVTGTCTTDFKEINKGLNEVTLSDILFNMITEGSDEAELQIELDNGIGVVLNVKIDTYKLLEDKEE